MSALDASWWRMWRTSRNAVRHLVSRFFGNSREALVLNLLEDEDLGKAELQRIRDLIVEDSAGEDKPDNSPMEGGK